MVRPGTCLYGLPSFDEQEAWGLKALLQLKARIVDLKEVADEQAVGYGYANQISGKVRLATVALGYADGLYLFFLKNAQVLVGQKRAPVFGRSFMSHLLIDVTGIPEARIGDEVVLLGEQGEERITAEELTHKAGIGTTNCEIVCQLSPNLPRIYYEEGRIVHCSLPGF